MLLMKALGLSPVTNAVSQMPMAMRSALGGTAAGTGGTNQMNPALLMALYNQLRNMGTFAGSLGKGAMNMTPIVFPQQVVDQVLQQLRGQTPQG